MHMTPDPITLDSLPEDDLALAQHNQLEELARQLARSQSIGAQAAANSPLLDRVQSEAKTLQAAYLRFKGASREEIAFSYAAEWMLDNFYVVEQTLRLIREDMPRGYYHQLPILISTPLTGYPRIFGVAWEIVEHSRSQLDIDHVGKFVQAYQAITPLTMGELWALPTMLRLAIIENLTGAVARITGLTVQIDAPFSTLSLVTQKPTDDTLVANCFHSLRLLSTQEWKRFFETVSHVEQILRHDPAGIYTQMDFETRDHYRRLVEELARSSHQSEETVAHLAIDLAARNAARLDSQNILHVERTAHVGFFLMDRGRAQLQAALAYRPTTTARLRGWLLAHPTLSYLGSIALLAAFFLALLVSYGSAAGASTLQMLLVTALALLPATMVAVDLINWLVTHVLPPRVLPRLDFEESIPAECRTLIVVPTLLGHENEIGPLLQELELHFLRNSDPHLAFALLTDFPDAPEQHMPGDAALLERMTAGIRALNDKYRDRGAAFFFFHRERRWNPAEECWMGWERKRGKLAEFNALLSGSRSTSYIVQEGNLDILPDIRYVITLDVDTILPQGSASRLVATLAHPLNRAVFAPDSDRVVAGYTILQPRIDIKPTSASQSPFARIFSGDIGLDLYTKAVSDVYQDLFGEGTYVGKGIYDVAAFERSLANRVPENSLLSHDLFEGIHARAALVTDISVFEDYPSSYIVFTHRLHRWIRGDWQLLPWLLPRVPTASGTAPNRLSLIARWKILDNLRRSLAMPALLALLIAGWLGLPGSPLGWTVVVLLTLAVPLLLQAVTSVMQGLGQHLALEILHSIQTDLTRWLLAVFFLPHEALVALDAILTTLYRLLVSRKHLLRWTTAAHTARLFGTETGAALVWQQMLATLILAPSVALVVALTNLAALPIAALFIIAWLVSPAIAYRISRPMVYRPTPLSAEQREELRALARRTWLFFEQFVGPADHWLPPDHFQESPLGVIAHHTSPTNVGLFLLSILAAHDMGYIGLLGLALRLRSTFEEMEKLERYRGHFLNWYDTQTLAPLMPRYVSTVDSGNLAGSLLALRQGCLALPRAPVVGAQRWQALGDVLILLDHLVARFEGHDPDQAAAAFQAELRRVRQRVLAVQDKPEQWASLLLWLADDAWQKLSERLIALIDSNLPAMDADTLSDLRQSMDRLSRTLGSIQRNMDLLLPWLVPFNDPPSFFTQPGAPPRVAGAWQALHDRLMANIPRLGEATTLYEEGKRHLRELADLLDEENVPQEQQQAAKDWCRRLMERLDTARLRVQALLIGFQDVAAQAEAFFEAMEFGFLFDEQREVFHIGYNVTSGRLDNNYYDLLASEARLASVICIAKGDVPRNHWLHLARPVTEVNGTQVLLSWSGTMFEYLMPYLLMRDYAGTFLSHSDQAAVDYQIAYGQAQRVPWGMSESGYYAFDANLNYQYRAFGVPRLGFKRGLAEDVVVTPYASLLALSLRPQAVIDNLARFKKLHMVGHYGLYESIDYTEARLPPGHKHAVVQSYMAHHQAMIMLSLCNYLHDEAMIRRFHADPRIQSVELLLQERIPQEAPVEYPHQGEVSGVRPVAPPISLIPWRVPVDSAIPQAHFLAHGRYGLLVTSAGGGYSQWQDIALTRWQADTTLDNWGSWLYVQDRQSNALWSAAFQPTAVAPDSQEVLFYPHKVEYRRRDGGLSLLMEIGVAPDEVEIRRITLTNDTEHSRQLRLTSYAEVVLAPPSTDLRHPAFNKLFVESEYVAEANALVFRRRPRAAKEKPLYLVHALVVQPGQPATGAYESDRARFLGRGQTLRRPAALREGAKLSGTIGATLDPIMALGQDIDLEPHTRAQVAYLTLVAASRDEALALTRRYQAWAEVERAFDQSRAQCEIELRQLGLDTSDLAGIDQLLSVLLYPASALRASPETLAANRKGQPGLWAYGISGDYPILLVKVTDPETPLVRELLRAFAYWRNRQIRLNLVILNQQDVGYSMESHNQLYRQIARAGADRWLNQRDGIFLLRADQMPDEDKVLLETVARAVLDSERGSLAQQIGVIGVQPVRLPPFLPTLPDRQDVEPTPPLPRPAGLVFDNGLGGFSADGREYIIYLQPDGWTPLPWINVVANPHFGFLVSEAGAGTTWAENSGENRLTPWRNDPVGDSPGEALYIRDEETAQVWSPTPLPARAPLPYLVRHGAGYSIFEHHSHGLKQELRLFAVQDAPLKVVRLRLENLWQRPRRITVTYYAEWVMGTNRDTFQQYIIPEFDGESRALLAYNRYNVEFGARVAFVAASKELHGLTADRTEFLGRMGSLSSPAALDRIGLAGMVDPGLDPCAALQLHVDLAPGESQTVFFLVGQAADRTAAVELIGQYQTVDQVDAAWQAVTRFWDDLLDTISVQTPDPAMNLMLNRWLLYQALSCRIWGRSALYQSSGAFGFRDQLQDVMALIHARPDLARAHILLSARHQFEAGDVLHWWHPPSGRGIRTRFSDDLLWLPFVTAHYVSSTGDQGILSEKVPYRQGESLKPEEEERYGQYELTADTHTLYDHCRRALRTGLTAGPHGLPLIGTGDWNDGMNRVGAEGKGESVWLGWFVYATLCQFVPLCELMDDPEQAARYRQEADKLRQALEAAAWDGAWYRRAYYDDGWPLGSQQNRECQIDSIAQSWAVLSGAADPERAAQAMESVEARLVRRDDGLILLFTPPFDKTARDPGYVKGYVPGIRENGGQYTHAALWAVWAFAQLDQGDRAEALFRLLNPIYHADSPERVNRYRVEPYVIAADVYGVAPHVGRGGWTWYTGSAAWMYRLGIEAILGLYREGQTLRIDPCIPRQWPGFDAIYRQDATYYEIHVENPDGVNRGITQVSLDGRALPDTRVPLLGDGQRHRVVVQMGRPDESVPSVQAEATPDRSAEQADDGFD
jgi:cyclic beta-1,2-glucan synthetase